jgi:hypothetical protein
MNREEPVLIVLEPQVGASAVRELADRVGWQPAGATTRGFDVLASLRFAAPEETDLLYAEDHTADCRWIRIEGPRASSVELVVRGALPWVRREDVFARIAGGDPLECIRAAGPLSVMRPPYFDPSHYAALRKLLEHPEAAVRRAGVRAAFGCRWRQLRGLVDDLLKNEERPQPRLEALASWLDSPEGESGQD